MAGGAGGPTNSAGEGQDRIMFIMENRRIMFVDQGVASQDRAKCGVA